MPKKIKRKNPIAYNEDNLRRWAFTSDKTLPHISNLLRYSLEAATKKAAIYFYQFYYEQGYIFADYMEIYEKIFKIFSYWMKNWKELSKKSSLLIKNQWKDFIFTVDLPQEIAAENILRGWIYDIGLRSIRMGVRTFLLNDVDGIAINLMRRFNYSRHWENNILETFIHIINMINDKWYNNLYNLKERRQDRESRYTVDDIRRLWEIFMKLIKISPFDPTLNNIYQTQILRNIKI